MNTYTTRFYDAHPSRINCGLHFPKVFDAESDSAAITRAAQLLTDMANCAEGEYRVGETLWFTVWRGNEHIATQSVEVLP